MSGTEHFAQVILPLAVEGTYTYSVPVNLAGTIQEGCRVLVPFGKKRIYSAIVHSLGNKPPDGFTPKSVIEIIDEQPAVTKHQLQLWSWMSSYYLCTMGEIMRAAIPSGLRPESESRVRINTSYQDEGVLNRHERLLYEVVKDQGEVTLGDLELAEVTAKPVRILQKLVELGAVEINEFVRSSVKPRIVSYIRLTGDYANDESLVRLLDQLERAPRQKKILETYLQLTDAGVSSVPPLVFKKELLQAEGSSGALSALLKKGIFEQADREEMNPRGDTEPDQTRDPHTLNIEQSAALDQIRIQFGLHQAVLLQGVTSSGKTELYMHLIKEMVDNDRQVLYLLPEIALTTQIIQRMRQVFGNKVGVYHSRYSDSERVHLYRNLLGLTDDEPFRLIIGVRSAIFLPFKNLGLVIIDEEHETTFKQQDPAPRYHARDSAQVLALYHDAKVLLGTATPSFESLYNARTGKFGFAVIPSRFGEAERPEIILADTKVALKRKQMVSHFTPQLIEGIREAVGGGQQVILFQNRRGYSNYIVCNDCGDIPKCSRCDVSLTFHRHSGKLECHYCGHRESMPRACHACASTNMTMKGFGTEKIEDEIAIMFEDIRVGRLDTDAARSARGYEKVLRSFEAGNLDVLVGTQMLSKGLDFENVSLVGILDADSMLHYPDFRAFERSFQLISQVSGRAGRRNQRGKVIIQTMDPEHPVIRHVLMDDYEGLYNEQMEERRVFGYPPFRRMIRVSFRHRIPSILDGATDLAGKKLKKIFSNRVFGPQYPPVRKVQNQFVKQIILKIEREASHERARELLIEVLHEISASEVFRSVRISVDVDPY